MIQCIHCHAHFTGTGQEATQAGWYCQNFSDAWFCQVCSESMDCEKPRGMTEEERAVDIAIEAELEDRAFGEGRHAP